MDNDENKSGDTRPDDGGEVSGVFTLKSVRDTVDEHRDSLEKHIQNALARQELFGFRAKVRNDFRGFFESDERLARVFGVPYIPKMSAGEIAKEEEARIDRKAARIAQSNRNDPMMRAVHNFLQVSESHLRDSNQVELEEKAKYVGSKLRYYFRCMNVDAALKVFREYNHDFPFPHERGVFEDVVHDECKTFLEALASTGRFQDFVEAFPVVAQMTSFDDNEFRYLNIQSESQEFEEALVKILNSFLEEHVAVFARVAQTMIRLGLITFERLASHKQLYDGIVAKLVSDLEKHPQLYLRSLSQLHKDGYIDATEFHDSVPVRRTIFSVLVSEMDKGLPKYFAIRDLYVSLGLLDQGEADNALAIRDRFEQSVMYMSQFGDETRRQFVEFLAENDMYLPVVFRSELMKSDSNFFDKLWRAFLDFQEGVSLVEMNMNLESTKKHHDDVYSSQLSHYVGQLRLFLRKYPMFRRNRGSATIDR